MPDAGFHQATADLRECRVCRTLFQPYSDKHWFCCDAHRLSWRLARQREPGTAAPIVGPCGWCGMATYRNGRGGVVRDDGAVFHKKCHTAMDADRTAFRQRAAVAPPVLVRSVPAPPVIRIIAGVEFEVVFNGARRSDTP